MLNATGLLRYAIILSVILTYVRFVFVCVPQIEEHTEVFNDMRAISGDDDVHIIGISPEASYAVFLAAGVSADQDKEYF